MDKTPTEYIVFAPRIIGGELMAEPGDSVYEFLYDDFGLAEHESKATQERVVSVTLNSDGTYPSFTIPRAHIVPADEVEEFRRGR